MAPAHFFTLPIGPSEARMLAASTDQLDVMLAAAYCKHGDSWRVEDTATGGDLGPPQIQFHGPYELYVVVARDWVIALNSTDTLVPDASWMFVAPWVLDEVTGQLEPIFVDENNVLHSLADGSRFLVQSVYQDVYNTVGTCEMLDSPPVASAPATMDTMYVRGVGDE
jgi:hypothetical protein